MYVNASFIDSHKVSLLLDCSESHQGQCMFLVYIIVSRWPDINDHLG